MTTGDTWDQLVTTAFLGTRRRPLRLTPTTEEPFTDLVNRLAQCGQGEDAQRLLGAAALAGVARRAGQSAIPVAKRADPPAPPERLRPPTRRATQLLQTAMHYHRDLVPEWLQVARLAGVHIPHECLPELLSAGWANTVNITSNLAPVVGERGIWLARQMGGVARRVVPLPTPLITTGWETANSMTRAEIISALRRTDPLKANELLLSIDWAKESPSARNLLLWAMAEHLSPADEPILEKVMATIRTGGANLAAELLARLPDSSFARRMLARARPTLHLEWVAPPPFARISESACFARIAVRLPESPTPDLEKDGIQLTPDPFSQFSQKGRGIRGHILQQILRYIPPSVWVEEWGLSPSELIRAAQLSDCRDVLIDGWSEAAALHRDPIWCEALLLARLAEARQTPAQIMANGLANFVPSKVLEEIIMAMLPKEGYPVGIGGVTYQLLETHCHPWSRDFSVFMIEEMARCAALDQPTTATLRAWRSLAFTYGPDGALWRALHPFGSRLHISVLDVLLNRLLPAAELSERWRYCAWNLVKIVRFRIELYHEMGVA
jgi:hypothetical protein